MELKEVISQFKLFEGVSTNTIDKLLRAGKVIDYKKGTMLIRFREFEELIYIQLTGKSVQYVLTINGKRKVLFILGKGQLLNNYIFNDRSASLYCETIENSQLFVIPVKEFTKILSLDFTLTKNILMAQEKKFGRLSHQLKNTTSSIPLEKKLLAKLWKLSKDFGIDTEEGKEIDIHLSITLLADMLGAPRETTSRLCSNLVELGLIKIEKKRIILLDSEKIRNYYKNEKK